MISGRCLICYKECAPIRRLEFSYTAISRELHAIFILRNIFEVPQKTIQEYLETGTNPSEWIQLCQQCKILVEKGKKIYKDILDASKKFRKAKGDIIQCLRRNKVKVPERRNRNSSSVGIRVTDETRRFVYENNYSESLVDPFVGGDCRAETLLYSGNVVTELEDESFYRRTVKTEYCSHDEADYEECGDQDMPLSPVSSYSEDNKKVSTSTTPIKFKRKIRTSAFNEPDDNHTATGSAVNSQGEMEWCCSCGRIYSGSEKLRRHLKEANMTSSEKFKCPFCDKQFKRSWDVKRHLTHHTDKEGNLPGGVTVTSVLSKVLSSRQKSVNKETVNAGPEEATSDQEADSNSNYDQEDALNDTESNGSTSDAAFGSIRHEQEAVKMADGTTFWKCSCGKIYLSEATLSQHINETNKESAAPPVLIPTQIICSVCDTTFKRRIERNRHMKKFHGMDISAIMEATEPEPTTDILGSSVEYTGILGVDLAGEVVGGADFDGTNNFEENQLLIKIDEVKLRDKTANDDKSHEELGLFETADGTEVWKCGCGKLYSSQTALHRHVKEKTMDPSSWLRCEFCDRAFKRTSELTRHVNNVHEKKKWDCNNCGKSFKAMSILRSHHRMKCSGS